MLQEIHVYGQLAKFLGRRKFKAAVSSAAEAGIRDGEGFGQQPTHQRGDHQPAGVNAQGDTENGDQVVAFAEQICTDSILVRARQALSRRPA